MSGEVTAGSKLRLDLLKGAPDSWHPRLEWHPCDRGPCHARAAAKRAGRGM